jgi:hypothetical protein
LFFLQLACLLAAFLHSEGANLAAAKQVQLKLRQQLAQQQQSQFCCCSKVFASSSNFLLLLLLFQLYYYYYSMNQQLHELPCK